MKAQGITVFTVGFDAPHRCRLSQQGVAVAERVERLPVDVRGLLRREYPGVTLRETLGLKRPGNKHFADSR